MIRGHLAAGIAAIAAMGWATVAVAYDDNDVRRDLSKQGYSQIEVTSKILPFDVNACRGEERFHLRVGPDGKVTEQTRTGACRKDVQPSTATAAPLASPKTVAPQLPDVVDHVSPSVVSVLVETPESEVAPAGQTPQGAKVAPHQGTGMVLSPEGHIITAAHVVDKAGKVTVVFYSGSQLPAQVVGRDLRTAVALLKVTPASALVPVRFADSRQLRRGQSIFAIGNPFGLQGSISSGLISALRRTGGPVPYLVIQTDGAVHPGNDGGPLFNENGDVIGMVSSVYSVSGAPTNIGYATPSNVVKEVAEKLQRSGAVERGWLGVQVRKPTEQEASSLALERGTGAIIMKVSEGGPAAKSGLVAGDIIATFVGQPVRGIDEFAWAIDGQAPDTEVTLGIVRKSGRSDVRVRLGRLNELQPSPAMPVTEKSPAKTQECVRYIPDVGLTVPVSCGE